MCSYYRRFIPNFSQIAEPIIALTRKYAHIKWSDTHQRAFEYLKDSLTAVPLLVYPDSNKPYVLYTDSSDTCIGACLTQECNEDEKPIYYLSHKLSRSQCKWSVVEKEAFAIHFALQKLDYYLHNSQFVIRIDHKPLKYLLESPMQNKKIQLWALSMAGYNCTIEYIAGTTNTCADLLSRHPDNVRKTSPGFNCWFSSAPVFQWCCSTPQGSPGVGRNTFLSSPHLCFIIVFICDLFVSRDDPLMS